MEPITITLAFFVIIGTIFLFCCLLSRFDEYSEVILFFGGVVLFNFITGIGFIAAVVGLATCMIGLFSVLALLSVPFRDCELYGEGPFYQRHTPEKQKELRAERLRDFVIAVIGVCVAVGGVWLFSWLVINNITILGLLGM